MSNYGNDRLALYTFESVIKFIQCWTNLRLSSAPPLQLGERYFQLYPEEVDPVWGVSRCVHVYLSTLVLYLVTRRVLCIFFCHRRRIHATIKGTKRSGPVIKLAINYHDFS